MHGSNRSTKVKIVYLFPLRRSGIHHFSSSRMVAREMHKHFCTGLKQHLDVKVFAHDAQDARWNDAVDVFISQCCKLFLELCGSMMGRWSETVRWLYFCFN